jgi:hypothetical protein
MHMMLQEESCPVAAEVLGRLYAASPAELPALVQSVPSAARARLAVYCSRRAHLTAIGRTLAAHCAESELEREAGKYGLRLFEDARDWRDPVAAPTRGRRAVSLSTGMLRRVVRDDDEEESADASPGLVGNAA